MSDSLSQSRHDVDHHLVGELRIVSAQYLKPLLDRVQSLQINRRLRLRHGLRMRFRAKFRDEPRCDEKRAAEWTNLVYDGQDDVSYEDLADSVTTCLRHVFRLLLSDWGLLHSRFDGSVEA